MRNSLIIALVFLVLSSCYKVEKPKKPANLISKDKMVSVLVDLSIMSSAKGVNKKLLENNGIVPDSFIYQKHEIDSTIFAESTSYYAFDIETFDEIYKKVHDSLTILRDKYKAIEANEKREKEKKDSLNRVKVKTAKELNLDARKLKPKIKLDKKSIPLKPN